MSTGTPTVPQATSLPRTPHSSRCVKPNHLPTTVMRTSNAANNPTHIRERDNTSDFLSRCPWPSIISLIAVSACLVSKENEKNTHIHCCHPECISSASLGHPIRWYAFMTRLWEASQHPIKIHAHSHIHTN